VGASLAMYFMLQLSLYTVAEYILYKDCLSNKVARLALRS
jgi:hypothetical protein